ncbi:MAG: sugar phosphate isomerase/epimerase [Lachnospiraceae bacterium]|nr:sugar phosphate isomerase/epimerase [Lachnospiraceae bacterium]
MKWDRIALQLYSVRDEMKADFYGTLKKVKEMGYTGVEFAGLHGHDPLEVKQMCEELGLERVSAHVDLELFLSELEETVECYRKLGVPYVTVPFLDVEYRPGKEAFLSIPDSLKKIGEAVKKAGMTLQYHNHDFEFLKIEDDIYGLDYLYREVSPELLQTQLDTCWIKVTGEDPVEYLKKYAGRIPTVHLKDFVGRRTNNMYGLLGKEEVKAESTEKFGFRPLGKGVQDFPAVVAAGIENGAKWFIVEQDSPSLGYTPLQCAEISVKYLLNEVFV